MTGNIEAPASSTNRPGNERAPMGKGLSWEKLGLLSPTALLAACQTVSAATGTPTLSSPDVRTAVPTTEVPADPTLTPPTNPTENPTKVSEIVPPTAIDYANDEIFANAQYGSILELSGDKLIPKNNTPLDPANEVQWVLNAQNNAHLVATRTGVTPSATQLFTNGQPDGASRNAAMSFSGQSTIMWPSFTEGQSTFLSASPSEYWFPVKADQSKVTYTKVTLPSGYTREDVRMGWVGDNQSVELAAKGGKGMMLFNPMTGEWRELKKLSLEQQATAKMAVIEFVSSMKSVGIMVTPEQILQKGLTIKKITTTDGKNYEIATTFLDPNPGVKGEAWEGDYPILVRIEGGEWSSNTARPIFDMLGLNMGGLVDGSEKVGDPIYENTVGENFSIIFPGNAFFQSELDKRGPTEAQYFIDLARRNNQIMYIHAGFYRSDQNYLENLSTDQRIIQLQNRAKNILQFVKPIDGSTQQNPTYVCIFNEPFSRYHNGDGEDTAGWKNESLTVKTLGADSLIESYMMFYNEAKAQGLEVGKDVYFFISEYGINTNNPKTQFALREFERAKVEIAKRLKIPVSEVHIGLTLEQRYNETDPATWPANDWPTDDKGRVIPPTEQELDTTMKAFSKIFDKIIFSEVSDFSATPEQRQAHFDALLRIAKKYHVEAIIFENPLRLHDGRSVDTDLFTSSGTGQTYTKGSEYYDLVQEALSLLEQK